MSATNSDTVENLPQRLTKQRPPHIPAYAEPILSAGALGSLQSAAPPADQVYLLLSYIPLSVSQEVCHKQDTGETPAPIPVLAGTSTELSQCVTSGAYWKKPHHPSSLQLCAGKIGFLIKPQWCLVLELTFWLSDFMVDGLVVVLMAQLRFYVPNLVDYFYCDFSPLMVLACSDTGLVQVTTFVLFVVLPDFPLWAGSDSYAQIVVTVLRVPSESRRLKGFSTCSSHLAVVSTFYGTLMVLYPVPSAVHFQLLSKVIALLFTIVTATFNPGIYALRIQEVQQAIRRLLYCNPTEMGPRKRAVKIFYLIVCEFINKSPTMDWT
ncbi:LOW QUALITY PROTEIN: olfactory receptor 11A1-like [Rattus rattus]|uniref:LOW QUALITY PROTEIN: olfactory receptor 11A1-like n=1 Tax=Rattus rattus TaxID=10117 RepID=UPI0013F2DBD4|nr:LOW QUALITY PROTEIN: olfactory receptor 11A1-like [Rattus rattus]